MNCDDSHLHPFSAIILTTSVRILARCLRSFSNFLKSYNARRLGYIWLWRASAHTLGLSGRTDWTELISKGRPLVMESAILTTRQILQLHPCHRLSAQRILESTIVEVFHRETWLWSGLIFRRPTTKAYNLAIGGAVRVERTSCVAFSLCSTYWGYGIFQYQIPCLHHCHSILMKIRFKAR